MKIDLYLNDHLVEINKDIDFVLNKQYTELSDLTAIIVDYSKTINVPMTSRNNELFNYIYKLDHKVFAGQNIINYDPTQKIPMSLLFNGDLVMEGYAVLSKVNLKDQTYEINLYGQLGKIFSELKEKTIENYNKGYNNGIFKTGDVNRIKMCTNAVAKSFLNDDHSLDWTSTDWTDFWGYAPQFIGSSDLLDTTEFEAYDGSVLKFEDLINERRNITWGDVYVGDGLDIHNYGEVRTYMTRPYVYVDKLIQMVQQEINTGDYGGYTMTLDEDWFNETNPYYKNLCYFPGRETIVDDGASTTGSVTWNNNEQSFAFPVTYLPSTSSIDLDDFTYTTDTSNSTITISNAEGSYLSGMITLNCDGITVRDYISKVTTIKNFEDIKWAYYNAGSVSSYVPLRYIGIYDGDDNLLYKLYLCDNEIKSIKKYSGESESTTTITNEWTLLKNSDSRNIVPTATSWTNSGVSGDYVQVTQIYNFGTLILPTNSFKFKMQCDIVNIWTGNVYKENIPMSDYHTLCPYKNKKYKDALWTNDSTYRMYIKPIPSMSISSLTYRSMSLWSIYEVLGEDFNPFTWLIDYVKKFRLFFDIDYKTRTINLSSGFFKNPTFKKVDVDYSKSVTIEPLNDIYEKVDYGYADNEGKKASRYKNKYNVNYGDLNLTTGIKINNETMDLIPDEDESVFIPVRTNGLYWVNLTAGWPGTIPSPLPDIKYGDLLMTNKIINTLDTDNEITYFPFYCFRDVNSTYRSPYYRISDDTPTQRNSGKYYYLDTRSPSESGFSGSWYTEVEGKDSDGNDTYYLKALNYIPQFDNYIAKAVTVTTTDDGDSDSGSGSGSGSGDSGSGDLTETTYYYNVKVIDSNTGLPISGATVNLYTTNVTNKPIAVNDNITGSDGKFSYSVTNTTIPPMLYVEASKTGYSTNVRTWLSATEDSTYYEKLSLTPSTTDTGTYLTLSSTDDVTATTKSAVTIDDETYDYEGVLVTNDTTVKKTVTYTDPVSGGSRAVYLEEDENKVTTSRNLLYWSTFNVPMEVYNGSLPDHFSTYTVYDRWKNYLTDLFNPNNKKVTCYIRMDYPDFINFKFNQLFVIDNCLFLVNKIIDFNPNDASATQVELLQISSPDVLS